MTLYDINKIQYSKLPKMLKSEKARAIETLCNFILNSHNDYYALLNHDNTRYFTVFVWDSASAQAFAEEVFATAESIGEVKAVETNNEGFIEIWIKQKGHKCNMYGFLKYDEGVIVV